MTLAASEPFKRGSYMFEALLSIRLLGPIGAIRLDPPAPERSSVDLAGPSSNHFRPGAGTRQPRTRRGDRARDRPRDDRRGARAHGTGRAETARALRPLRSPKAVPLSRGTRAGDARRRRAA